MERIRSCDKGMSSRELIPGMSCSGPGYQDQGGVGGGGGATSS